MAEAIVSRGRQLEAAVDRLPDWYFAAAQVLPSPIKVNNNSLFATLGPVCETEDKPQPLDEDDVMKPRDPPSNATITCADDELELEKLDAARRQQSDASQQIRQQELGKSTASSRRSTASSSSTSPDLVLSGFSMRGREKKVMYHIDVVDHDAPLQTYTIRRSYSDFKDLHIQLTEILENRQAYYRSRAVSRLARGVAPVPVDAMTQEDKLERAIMAFTLPPLPHAGFLTFWKRHDRSHLQSRCDSFQELLRAVQQMAFVRESFAMQKFLSVAPCALRERGSSYVSLCEYSVPTLNPEEEQRERKRRAQQYRSMSKLGGAARRLFNGANKLAPAVLQIQQNRTVVHKSLLRLPEEYPEPWDYKHKGFNFADAVSDSRTQDRFHQNSKLIVVEGNIGSGKSSLAKELADQLGFHHMPEFKMDDILVDRYGNDLRNFYHLFPKRYRMPDIKMFYKNPMDELSAAMQDRIFQCRFEQYLNALAHILNTGQGVVLEKSPHSDFTFTNAMRAKNYIGHEYFKHYYYVRKNALPQLHFWPHLVIYLDTPVAKCLENIKRRGNVDEISTVDETYLKTIEESYKDVLKEFRRHSKILAYDWSTPGDTDRVVEDIERVDLDFFEWHSGDVLEEWYTLVDEVGWNGWRQHVTNKHDARRLAFDAIPTHEVGELYTNPRDTGHFLHVMRKEVLKSPYGYGYINKNGDEMAGLMNWRTAHHLPEPWYDYYHKEAYYDDLTSHETSLDWDSDSYDPDYVHHHH